MKAIIFIAILVLVLVWAILMIKHIATHGSYMAGPKPPPSKLKDYYQRTGKPLGTKE